MSRAQVLQGDCIQVMRTLKDNSVDSIVTDPPAGIAFMNKEWDDFRRSRNPADVSRDNVFGRTSAKGPEYGRGDRDRFVTWMTAVMTEAIRVLKPGGHALVWSIPRTSHWTAWALEDAGFEIRDCIMHIFGTGFPKSLDISKAIDKAAGAERKVTGVRDGGSSGSAGGVLNMNGRDMQHGSARTDRTIPVTEAATEAAKQWEGWGTALKPSYEGWWLCRKPFREKTAAANVLEWGTGGINVDGCRVETGDNLSGGAYAKDGTDRHDGTENWRYKHGGAGEYVQPSGRFPPNLLLSEEAAAEMDEQSGILKSGSNNFINRSSADQLGNTGAAYGAESRPTGTEMISYGDSGGASRFFPVFRYQAKAKPSERPKVDGINHPTVKPLGLMRWLVRLVTPPGGICLDLFAGSGTTGEACLDEGFNCILIEREPDYIKLIKERLGKHQPTLLDDP